MRFESDVFISYAQLDNQELIEGHKGWVANFHRALQIRVGQLIGRQPEIWRDPKLKGSDYFEDILVDRLRKVAVLISVLSPRYIKSEWTRRELREFWENASASGGVRVGDISRIFKVLKTPVSLDQHPPELRPILGYEFFKIEPETGRARELDQVFGPEAQRDFWMKVDDIAHDLCLLLEVLQAEGGEPAAHPAGHGGETIFLAETTFDLRPEYEAIRRDLQQHGHLTLPARQLPMVAPDLEAIMREELERCRLSVHLVGRNYSLVPEGGTRSILEIQNDLAVNRSERGNFLRLLWIPPDLQVEDERQRQFIQRLRTDERILRGAELLETPLEDLRTYLHDRLRLKPAPAEVTSDLAKPGDALTRVYLVCDQRDQDSVTPWTDFLFESGFEVMTSFFDGDEAEVREYHEECLRICDAALIHYGHGNELWLRRKLREVQKSAGYGRERPIRAVAVSVAPPITPAKERFRTHEAMVIQHPEGFAPDALHPFIQRLNAGGTGVH